MTTIIYIERTRIAAGGALYRITRENGGVLIKSSHSPEFEACRALLAEGITGRLEVWRKGAAFPAMRLDIERGAGLTVSEGVKSGPKIRPWQPYDGSAGSDRALPSGMAVPVYAGQQR